MYYSLGERVIKTAKKIEGSRRQVSSIQWIDNLYRVAVISCYPCQFSIDILVDSIYHWSVRSSLNIHGTTLSKDL